MTTLVKVLFSAAAAAGLGALAVRTLRKGPEPAASDAPGAAGGAGEVPKRICSPYLPGWEYVPDGEPHVFGDRLYVFGSHDAFGGKRFCMNDYVGWSAPLDDLADWRYEGVTYYKTQDPDNRDGKKELWAPDVARGADGRYYLYYCLANVPKIGVAVCDTPAGRYEFLGYVADQDGAPLGQRPDGLWPFDPAVLVDDDGRVHLYTGQGPRTKRQAEKKDRSHRYAWHMELEPDMLTVKTTPEPVIPSLLNSAGTGFEGHEFFEASSIRKFDGRYYFIYSSLRCHELCWSVSDRPDGGFTYGGVLVSNGDITEDFEMDMNGKPDIRVRNYIGNNHGSVEKINGAYYVFYHRQTNRNMYARQGCAAKITMRPDGSFEQAEMTSCGLSDALPGRGRFEARIACQLYAGEGGVFSAHPAIQNRKHPAFTQDQPDGFLGEQYIENLRDSATAVFKYFEPAGAIAIRAVVRGKGSGKLIVRSDGRIVAELPVTPQKDWHSVSAPFRSPEERAALSFTWQGDGSIDFKEFELI